MRRRAALWRLSASARSAALRAGFAFLATALVTVFGAVPANCLTARHAPDGGAAEVGTPAISAAAATVAAGAAASPGVSDGTVRGGVPKGPVLTASAGSDDSDDRGVVPPGADVSHPVRSVGPVVPASAPVTRARWAASGVMSTVWGRAPPA